MERGSMTAHAAVRSGDQPATLEMLLRLTRQAVRRHNTPSPRRGSGWTTQDYEDLLGGLFADKGNILEIALLNTTTDRDLELYLLSTIENYLRDQARSTELGKLIDRLKTILGQDSLFFRHTRIYPAWRLTTAPDEPWLGDLGDLIRAALRLRGIAVYEWNTAGRTPKATRNAIIRVCEAALDKAAGYVRDPELARVVQTCVPAVPLNEHNIEVATDTNTSAAFHDQGESLTTAAFAEPDQPTTAQVAAAIWATLTHDECRAVPHLDSARRVGTLLGIGRRAADALTVSVKSKIRLATTAGTERAVLDDLLERAGDLERPDDHHPEGAHL